MKMLTQKLLLEYKMEEYNHYYVITEVFNEQPKANYVMHSPEALLSVAAHIYTEWA